MVDAAVANAVLSAVSIALLKLHCRKTECTLPPETDSFHFTFGALMREPGGVAPNRSEANNLVATSGQAIAGEAGPL